MGSDYHPVADITEAVQKFLRERFEGDRNIDFKFYGVFGVFHFSDSYEVPKELFYELVFPRSIDSRILPLLDKIRDLIHSMDTDIEWIHKQDVRQPSDNNFQRVIFKGEITANQT